MPSIILKIPKPFDYNPLWFNLIKKLSKLELF
jgi:hypothetical protein